MAKARGPKRAVVQCDTIGLLADGMFGRVVDGQLDKLFEDLDERGHDGKARTLTITLTLTLVPAGGGVVYIDAKATSKVPPEVPPRTTAKMNKAAGGLVFNPEVADSPDQMTINDLDPAEADHA